MPGIDKACSAWVTSVCAMASGLTPALARAYYAKGFREEGHASKPHNGGVFAGGLTKDGKGFAAYNFETNCSGAAGQSNMDGLSTSISVWNPEVNMSDCETFEHIWPLMWLGRGIWRDGGGYGRRNGGSGVESLYVIEHEPIHIESGTTCAGDAILPSSGLFGGYPAPSRYRYTFTGTNYKELVEQQKPLPHREGDDPANPDFCRLMEGELVRTFAQSASRVYGHYDLIHQVTGGGGGWGDPLERDLGDLAKDIEEQIISNRAIIDVYKAALDTETMTIDPEQTKENRAQERQARLVKAIPVSDFVATQQEKILSGDIPDICKQTYNDCFANSSKFLGQFKGSWGLPEDFKGF